MKVTVDLSRRKYALLSLIPQFVFPFYRRSGWIVIAASLVLVTVLTALADAPIIRETDPGRFIFAVVGLFLSWFIGQYMSHMSMLKLSSDSDLIVTYSIQEEGLHFQREAGEGVAPWTDFADTHVFRNCIFQSYRRNHLIIPQSAFTSHTEFARFADELRSKISAAKIAASQNGPPIQ